MASLGADELKAIVFGHHRYSRGQEIIARSPFYYCDKNKYVLNTQVINAYISQAYIVKIHEVKEKIILIEPCWLQQLNQS